MQEHNFTDKQKTIVYTYGEGVRPAEIGQAMEKIRKGNGSAEEKEKAYKVLQEKLNRPL